MEFKDKIKKIKKILSKNKAIQLILKSEDPNFKWLLEEEAEKARLIITKKENTLITKPLEHLNKSFLKKDLKIIKIKKMAEIKEISKKLIRGKTLINYESITLKDKENLNLKKTENIEKELQELRSQKNEDEIKKIKTACEHTVKCWMQIIKKIKQKELKTEKQIEQHIKIYALKNNLGLAFNPIIASGKNAGTPHHQPENKLNKGFLVIDMGFDYKGYKSDMTRTIYLGKPTKKEKQIYEELLKVQETMITRAKQGKKAKKLYEETLNIMKTPELFIHGLGHGVGLQIHEKPSITSNSEDVLKNNQVLTIEPGYYTNKYGIRIEDTILLKKKPIILTKKAPKTLKIIQ
jgi:Xaa-Pro aminopeptidase